MKRKTFPSVVLWVACTSAAAQMTMPAQLTVSPSGAAVYSMSIQTPPGIDGMEPRLALVYGSQGGNGLLGAGWGLSGLSSITRCARTVAQDGVQGAVNHDINDRYCLDGQKLVAVSGAYGGDGSEYRTEIETFSKVVSSAETGTTQGPGSFIVKTREGLTLEYGKTPDSRIEAQGKASVAVWALNKATDKSGNFVVYSYEEDAANGDWRPSSISYTGNQTAGIATKYGVSFRYENRPDAATAVYYEGGAVKKLIKRLVGIDVSVSGSGVVKSYNVDYGGGTQAKSITLCGADGTCYPAFTAAYQGGGGTFHDRVATSSPDIMSGYTLVLGDFNGDGKTDVMYVTSVEGVAPPYGKGQQRSVWLSNGDGTFGPRVATYFADTNFDGYALQTGDFNGDGKTDIMYITDVDGKADPYGKGQQRSVWLSNGDGTFGSRITTSFTQTNFRGYQLVLGDFNGDGRTDIMYVTDVDGTADPYGKGQQRSVFLSNGDGTFGPRIATSFTDTNFRGYKLLTGDFNGDGRTDIMYVTDVDGTADPYGKGQQRSVFLSNGDGTFSPRIATSFTDTNFRGYSVQTGDFNGDGKTDIMYIIDAEGATTSPYGKGQQRSVFLSAGDGTFGPRVATTYTDTNFNGYRLMLGDFNGDGKTDIMYVSDAESIAPPYGKGQQRSLWLGNGDGTFGPRFTSSFTDTNFNGYALQLGDFNGDGKTDILYVTDVDGVAPPYAKGQQRSLWLAAPAGVSPFAMVSAYDGLKTYNIAYKNIADAGSGAVYTADHDAAYPRRDVQSALMVVSSVSTSDGVGGTTVNSYKYGGLKQDIATGRGSLGFRWQLAQEGASGMQTLVNYRQDFPYVGLPMSSTMSTSGGFTVTSISQTYGCADPASASQSACGTGAGSRFWVRPAGQRQDRWELPNSQNPSGIKLPSTQTSYLSYDNYGNLLSLKVETLNPDGAPSGYSTLTTNAYGNDLANWILGRLLRSTVTATTP